jgi:hypothetical protein
MLHLAEKLPRRRFLPPIALALLVVGACRPDPVVVDPEPRDLSLSILFIGNSLTYTNDLPGLLAAFVDSAGAGSLEVVDVSRGGYGLEDHWNSATTRSALDRGGWDLVVIQQGPSATEGRPSLLEYSALFSAEARKGGANLALYMVWPSLSRFFDFDGVFDSYHTAAVNEDALFFPCGEAWRVAWESDPGQAFYGADAFHPSLLGTYLAALVMFEQVTGRSPVGLPGVLRSRGGVGYAIDQQTARAMQLAAQEANRRHARSVGGWPPAGTR